MRSSGPLGPSGVNNKNNNNGNDDNRLDTVDLGYFDPYLDKAYGEGEVITIKKDTYYRNPILFIE